MLNLISFLLFMLFMNFLMMKFHGLELFFEWSLFEAWCLSWDFSLKIDLNSLIFSMIVLTITLHIFIYSISYVAHDSEKKVFYYLMMIFMLAMLTLIFSFNLSSILIGWDGLGISSFLLICYYHSNQSVNSSLITVMQNRVGDLLIILSICLFMVCLSWNLMIINFNFFSSVLLIFAAFSKSAQIPFSNWLPKAMSAPTPVSSLVHSSTLVTAGVYLVYRMNFLMWELNSWLFFVSFFSLLISSMMALCSFDLKEIIAFSTLSHISLMFMSLSCSMSDGAFFHLCTHALFKALMFMCSGFMIYIWGYQDIRKLKFFSVVPMVKFSFLYSGMAMMGLPFLSGFMSKDLIIDLIFSNENSHMGFMFMVSIFSSSLYTIRLIKFLSLDLRLKFVPKIYFDWMSLSINSLSLFSLVVGAFYQWFVYPLSFVILSLKFKFLILLSILSFIFLAFYIHIFMSLIFIWFNQISTNFFYVNFFFFKKKNIYLFMEKGWLFNILISGIKPFYMFKKIKEKKIIILIFWLFLFTMMV